jgi:hypothetical protein
VIMKYVQTAKRQICSRSSGVIMRQAAKKDRTFYGGASFPS